MFTFDQLSAVQIELTSRCQASCPMCPRNLYGGLENPNLVIDEWTLDDFKQIMNEEVLGKMLQVLFCGQYGDALLNPYLHDICRYIVESNPNTMINIHTNGSLHKEEYWRELARILPKFHTIHFGIDGFEDTHSLYRIGTDYNKVIRNMKAFIDAGGNATWDFLRFKHNEHQVDAARKFAEELGCKSFAVKDTTRFINGEPFKVVDKNGSILHYLEPASDANVSYINQYIVDNYKDFLNVELDCFALDMKRVYIDASKRVFPCGPHAMTVNDAPSYDDIAEPLRQIAIKETQDIYKNIIEINNASTHSLKEIINSSGWQYAWNQYVHGKERCITCVRNCGRFDNGSLTRFGDEDVERSPLRFD